MRISEDLLVEVLKRLQVKTIGRCLCVSKQCASIIRSPHFIKAYQSRSSTRQPRVMVALRDIFMTFVRWHFFSSSHPLSLVINGTCYIDSTSLMPVCVNGLICVEHMYRLWICNPVTGKVVPLPLSAPRKPFTTWYMGYDPINYQYKVLLLSKECLLCPYKVEVFTLGGQGSLNMIEEDGDNDHSPATRGICIDGVVYYGAHTEHGTRVVRFYVATEKLGDFIEVPAEASSIYGMHFGFYTLVNYQGKLALLAQKTISRYDLWVLEDAMKQEWSSKVSIVITRRMCPYDLVWPGVVGFVAGSGELIATARDRFYQFYLVYVDLKTRRSRVVWFPGVRSSYRSPMVLAFTDYVESIMLL